MGYDSIIKVASDSTIDWEDFREEYLERFAEYEIGKEIHGCAYWENTPLFAEISTAFPTIHFRFYYFYFDFEGLTIYEYLNGERLNEEYVDPPKDFLAKYGFCTDGFVWNPRLVIRNEITDYCLPEE